MPLTIEEIALAISGHRFAEAYPYLADDIAWTIVGSDAYAGRQAVIAACDQSAAYLAGVASDIVRSRTVVGDDAVVVDTLTRYVDPDGGVSTVASCDIYDFADGLLTAIVSYNIELPGPYGA